LVWYALLQVVEELVSWAMVAQSPVSPVGEMVGRVHVPVTHVVRVRYRRVELPAETHVPTLG
jgi:hypothetical protein